MKTLYTALPAATQRDLSRIITDFLPCNGRLLAPSVALFATNCLFSHNLELRGGRLLLRLTAL